MPRSRLAAAIWFLGLVTVGLQALALATRYFQPWLSADYIYPQLFAEDLLAGRYPLSGWTLSSAPYFFPDMTVATVLRAVGGAGPVLPAYVVFTYVSLAVLAGWSLQRATGTGWTAWLAGVVFVNALLLWQPVTDHAPYLWLLGTVGFPGGAVLLGVARFALWAGGGGGGVSRGRGAVGLAGVGFARHGRGGSGRGRLQRVARTPPVAPAGRGRANGRRVCAGRSGGHDLAAVADRLLAGRPPRPLRPALVGAPRLARAGVA